MRLNLSPSRPSIKLKVPIQFIGAVRIPSRLRFHHLAVAWCAGMLFLQFIFPLSRYTQGLGYLCSLMFSILFALTERDLERARERSRITHHASRAARN